MPNPLVAKLSSFEDLSSDDARFIYEISSNIHFAKAGTDLIKEGDRPEVVYLLVDGWACRYKVLSDGRRQIMAYLLPGDLCDSHGFILKEMDHSIGLLSDAKIARISREKVLAAFSERPALARALWWSTLVDLATLREWIVNIGQRDAYHRIAHMFVEVWIRLRTVGLTDGGSLEMPLTQAEVGDTMGLTPVHVNRVMQRLRADGLVTLRSGRLVIPDIKRLMDVTHFEANYLHLDRREPGT